MKKDRLKKQVTNAMARKRYIQTMKIAKQKPLSGWRTFNAQQCRILCEQAFNAAPKRKRRKMLKILGATRSQIKEMA